MNKISTLEMEIAVAQYFNPRVNLIVPNVSWGLSLHEIDMLILTKNNYAYEVEIKISRVDLKADGKKPHGHFNRKISRLYFAIPDYLQCSADLIPKRAGIIVLSPSDGAIGLRCELVRNPKVSHDYRFMDRERQQLARLGAMRIWTLKRAILKIRTGH